MHGVPSRKQVHRLSRRRNVALLRCGAAKRAAWIRPLSMPISYGQLFCTTPVTNGSIAQIISFLISNRISSILSHRDSSREAGICQRNKFHYWYSSSPHGCFLDQDKSCSSPALGSLDRVELNAATLTDISHRHYHVSSIQTNKPNQVDKARGQKSKSIIYHIYIYSKILNKQSKSNLSLSVVGHMALHKRSSC